MREGGREQGEKEKGDNKRENELEWSELHGDRGDKMSKDERGVEMDRR